MRDLNEKITLYKIIFYSKKNKYEQAFLEKKKQNLMKEMQQDQVALESYMLGNKLKLGLKD